MTCGGCESSVSGALSEIEGVIDVFKVSHQAGAAVVCYDPAKLTDKSLLTSAVTKKGFKAELFVANTTTQSKKAATCAKTCTPAQQKACGVKTADASKEKDSGTK
ncbi:MAG: cation transporter [candidate division Zixibacteria bacterium]|nr:cation transporter [candidate division Zixibacteria bacterium]